MTCKHRGRKRGHNDDIAIYHCNVQDKPCVATSAQKDLMPGSLAAVCDGCPLFDAAITAAEKVFAGISWGNGQTISGPGSTLAATAQLRQELPGVLRSLGARSLLDIPCGDFGWMSQTELPCDYIGADVVRSIVAQNRQRYPGVRFEHVDIIHDRLPQADVILTRDCLVHFPYADIRATLRNVADSGARWFIATHFPGWSNHDIPLGSWRPLNLTATPLRLPPPEFVVAEGLQGTYAAKSLGVWSVEVIRAAVAQQQGPRLTIGLPYFRDWPGLWATIQSLRLHHAEAIDDVEIIVVDNDATADPATASERNHSFKARALCERIGARYEHFTSVAGTAAAKGRVFDLATAPAVLVMDCHVLLPTGTVRRLIDWFEAHPQSRDLWQGPCIGDGGIDDFVGTHFAHGWGSMMYGQWAVDTRIRDNSDEPFEIEMQGCGLFACRRDAWPGFHPLLRGFGPEEFHLHQRIRRNGGRCYCLPWLRWCHRFGNPDGHPVPGLQPAERLRGHLVTWLDTGAPDLKSIRNHFLKECKMPAAEFRRVLADTRKEFGDRQIRGLGDVVATGLKAIGIPGCNGCQQRQQALNEVLPFGG